MRLVSLVGGVLLVVMVSLGSTGSTGVSASQHDRSTASGKTCKTVVRKVHGHKKRHRVCHRAKPAPTPPPQAPAPPAADPAKAILATIDLHKSIGLAAVGFGALWVPNPDEDTVSRIDLATDAVTTIPVPDLSSTYGYKPQPYQTSVGAGSVWLTTSYLALYRLDPVTDKVTVVPLPGSGGNIDATDSAVWVTEYQEGRVLRIDPATNQVAATIPGPDQFPTTISAMDGMVWVGTANGSEYRIDPVTGQVVARIPDVSGGFFTPTAFGAGSVWLQTRERDDLAVRRINPSDNAVVATIPVDLGLVPCGQGVDSMCPETMTFAQDALWATNGGANQLVRIDPQTNAVSGTLTLPTTLNSVAYGGGALWTEDTGSDKQAIYKVDPNAVP